MKRKLPLAKGVKTDGPPKLEFQLHSLTATSETAKSALKPKKFKKEIDMFADSDSDSVSDTMIMDSTLQVEEGREDMVERQNMISQLHNQSDWDDADGYYLVRIGEMMNTKYVVRGNFGRGVFSNVVLCTIENSECGIESVAIKVIRNNPTMRRAAEKEMKILDDLKGTPHVIELLSNFEHKKHLCLVFKPMKMNLRQVLYQYGKNIGINMKGVQAYGKQLFIALAYLRRKGIVHADLKLDNILVSEKLGQVKLCDFGSAFYQDDPGNDPTPYLVSRYYRAPEIILGLKYDTAIDTWALATCLYELYTGSVMIPGKSNNEMLRLIMEFKGRFPNRMIKRHIASYQILRKQPHFDMQTLKFRQFQEDVVTKEMVMKLITIPDKTPKSVEKMLRSKAFSKEDSEKVSQLSNLLEFTLKLDPLRRATPSEALKHAFFNM